MDDSWVLTRYWSLDASVAVVTFLLERAGLCKLPFLMLLLQLRPSLQENTRRISANRTICPCARIIAAIASFRNMLLCA